MYSEHGDALAGLLNHQGLSASRVSDSVGLRRGLGVCMSDQFLDGDAGLGPHVEKHWSMQSKVRKVFDHTPLHLYLLGIRASFWRGLNRPDWVCPVALSAERGMC